MAMNEVTYVLESMEAGRDLRVADFVSQVGRFRYLLVRNSSRYVDWELHDVSRTNPISLVARAILVKEDVQDTRQAEIDALFGNWQALREGRVPDGIGRAQLMAFRRLAAGRTVRSTLINGSRSVQIDSSVVPVIDLALVPRRYAWGSADGRLELINVHGIRREIGIFPSVGPEVIICRFDTEHEVLLDEAARQYLAREVRVFGRLTYPARGRFPSHIQVECVEALREDLADPNEVRGIAPGLTGELSSEEFVRNLRSGN